MPDYDQLSITLWEVMMFIMELVCSRFGVIREIDFGWFMGQYLISSLILA